MKPIPSLRDILCQMHISRVLFMAHCQIDNVPWQAIQHTYTSPSSVGFTEEDLDIRMGNDAKQTGGSALTLRTVVYTCIQVRYYFTRWARGYKWHIALIQLLLELPVWMAQDQLRLGGLTIVVPSVWFGVLIGDAVPPLCRGSIFIDQSVVRAVLGTLR